MVRSVSPQDVYCPNTTQRPIRAGRLPAVSSVRLCQTSSSSVRSLATHTHTLTNIYNCEEVINKGLLHLQLITTIILEEDLHQPKGFFTS